MSKRTITDRWPVWLAIALACVMTLSSVLTVWQMWPAPAEKETVAPTVTTPASGDATTEGGSTTPTSAVDTTVPFSTTKAKPKVVLNVTSHAGTRTTTTEPTTTFAGTSDPRYKVKINGKEIKRDQLGAFAVDYDLKPGDNQFTFSHKGKTVTYVVHYKYVVMRSYSPSGSRTFGSGSTFSVVVSARVGSTVTATFRGKTVTLKQAGAGGSGDTPQSETFVNYSGSFTLPDDNSSNKNLGTITFKASYKGKTETARSGNIVCKKSSQQTIGEIVSFSAETFDGDKSDDDSRPTNNYLPKGTVDYVVGRSYFGDKEYLLLRCGRRVYVKKELSPPKKTVTVTKEYAGTLPSTNRLALDEMRITNDATYITFDTNWKAPFFLDLAPQSYYNPSKQDYRVSKVTYKYVEITFCYATGIDGKITIPANHPVFSKATVSKSGADTVLRLYLRNAGQFYGWDAKYTSKGQLEFYFLHPAQVRSANNQYGADLTGVSVLLDAGHGYKSGGASGLDSDHPEGERNYYLATLIKQELESIGARVILNRGAKEDMDQDKRCQNLKSIKPDLCIAIHHDSNSSSKPNGFGSFYSLPYSYSPAKKIFDATMAAGIYDSSAAGNRNRLDWHYYFVARMSDCPVVLTENGYMSSRLDHQGIVSDYVNWQKAQAITQGVAKYFLSIRLSGYVPPAGDKPVIVITGSSTTATTTTTTTTTKKTSAETTESTKSTEETTTGEPPTVGSGEASHTGVTIP